MGDDATLTAALSQFKRDFETRAADAEWHPSEEAVRQDLAVALRSALNLPTGSIEYEHRVEAGWVDLWVPPLRLAIEVKFHRPIPSGYNRPMTQQYGELLGDCNKLASADAAERLLVLVTDRAGATHVANKGLLPTSTVGGPKAIGLSEIERLAPSAGRRFLGSAGRWIPMSVKLVWRASSGSWTFFAWRVLPQDAAAA